MIRYFWFIIGYFISIFATHNFGWEPTIKTGWVLLGMWVFFAIVLKINKEDNALHATDDGGSK